MEEDKRNELNKELESKGLEGRLLNTLIYLNIEWTKARDGMKLSNIIDNLSEFYDSPDGTISKEKYALYEEQFFKDSVEMGRRDKKSETGFKEGSIKDYEERQRQYQILKNAIKNNERLANMTIGNQSWNMGEQFSDRKGLNACTFEDENGNIIVVYRGTGSGEWGDNGDALSGLITESPQQTQGREYLDYIVEKNEYDKKNIEITLTGHSKGGNKAQYAAISSKYRDLIKYCFSYDGQAFSPEAIEAFEKRFDDYNESLEKLYSFNGENDFVNTLGIYIIPGENRFYFKTVISSEISLEINSLKDLEEFLENVKKKADIRKLHYVDSCLTKEGTFSEQVEQGFISLFVENCSKEIMKLEPEKRAIVCNAVMSFLQGDNETVDGENVELDTKAVIELRQILISAINKALLDTVKEKGGILGQVIVAKNLIKLNSLLLSADVLITGVISYIQMKLITLETLKDIAIIVKDTTINILKKFKSMTIVTQKFKDEVLDSLKELGHLAFTESKKLTKNLLPSGKAGASSREVILEYGQSLGVALSRFILEASEAFGRLVKNVGVIIDDMIKISKSALKDIGKRMQEYVTRMIAVATNYFNTVISGIGNHISLYQKAFSNTWNSIVDKVTTGTNNLINNAKNIIRKGYEGLKAGVNKVVDFGKDIKTAAINIVNRTATECIRGIGLVIDKIKEAGSKIKEFGINLKETFLRFVSEAEKALVRLKDYVLGITNNIKEATQKGVKAIEDFKNKAERAILKFIESVANGLKNFVKYCKKEVVNAWNKVARKASQIVERVVEKTNKRIITMRENFENAVKYIIDYKKEKVKSIRDKKEQTFKILRSNTMKIIGATYIKNLKVDLMRLADLRKKMKELERECGEKIHYMLKDINNLVFNTERKYNEYYVRQRIREINRICDNIRSDSRRITDMIARNAKALDNACTEYKEIEAMISREVKVLA